MPVDRQPLRSELFPSAGAHHWASGGVSSEHTHDEGHLVYAARGVLAVHTDHGTSIVPANRLAWTIPHGYRPTRATLVEAAVGDYLNEGASVHSSSITDRHDFREVCRAAAADRPDLKIVEIGGGYGGQAHAIASWLEVSSYTVIDLPEVGLLQQHYLEYLHPGFPLRVVDADRFEKFGGADLFISNYAVSECRRPIARSYIGKVANVCASGYLTYNYMEGDCPSWREIDSWLTAEVRREPEVPNTDPKNCLLTWGSAAPRPSSDRSASGERR
jgi:hypothetical protein